MIYNTNKNYTKTNYTFFFLCEEIKIKIFCNKAANNWLKIILILTKITEIIIQFN